ncbi:hypothetical protein Chor_005821, partial [Crotalus horridus]
ITLWFPFLAAAPGYSPQRGTRNHALLEAAGPSHVAINAISANMESCSSRTAALKKQPSHMEAAHFGDLAQESKSSLSKTLAQVLRDPVALPYFAQYMELHRMEHLVRFWLEAETFCSATWSRIRAHSLNTVKHSSLAEPVSPCLQQQDPLGFSPLGESLNGGLDDCYPAEPAPACLSRPTLTLRNHLLLGQGGDKPCLGLTPSEDEDSPVPGIEQDAVTIFTKYISPDAAKPIPVTELMRNDIVAKICGEDGRVDPNCFVMAQSVVFNAMEQE